jgi:phospholipase C
MENKTWDQVLGNAASAPYATGLAHQCGTATRYASVGSPSLPNYIGATSGSTQGIRDDNPPSAHPITGDNLFRQVRAAGGSERSYVEAMTSPCQLSSSGQYAVKHNPAPYYTGADDRRACQADDVPFTAFAGDLAQGRLPTFAFVTPDLCNDTHDCAVKTGDTWLAGHLPDLLNSPAYRSGTTAVFVIWDEDTPMPNVIIAPSTHPGTVVTSSMNHYALLRTTEELLGLPTSLGAAASAPSFRSMFGM